jgi:BirA family biotin operon repressor/biotin-[acetyl-CoA-carboxylase] ligase
LTTAAPIIDVGHVDVGDYGVGEWRLEVHDSLASTNDALIARADAGEAEGLAILALSQTAGRGTQGRDWVAPAGNLSLSVLLRPVDVLAPGWSLVCAVALHEAVAGMLPKAAMPRLKWPNDLMLDDAKLAGILIETDAQAGWMVAGFGLNLAQAPRVAGRRTAAVADVAAAPDPRAAARCVFTALARWRAVMVRDGMAPVRAAWLRAGPAPGSALRVALADAVIEGGFDGLAEDGALLLRVDGGQRAVRAGVVLEGMG